MNTIRKMGGLVDSLVVKFFVDIGASDNYQESQTEPLLESGWSGVMFEVDPVKYQGLSDRMRGKAVNVSNIRIDPDNIVASLEKFNVPDGFLLALDIDGYDLFVLEAILLKYRPSIIISEINEKIPPPVSFTVIPSSAYKWGGNHFYGYSLQALGPLLKKFGYKIHLLDYNNVVLVGGTQAENLSEVYKIGYLNQPDRRRQFFYNADFEPIYSMSPQEMKKFCVSKFAEYAGQYKIEIGV